MDDWRRDNHTDIMSTPLDMTTLISRLHRSTEDQHHDVKFRLPDGSEVGGHKFVLSVASPVFESLFYGPMAAENTDVVTVKDVDSKAFRLLLYEANLSQDSGTNDPIVSVSDYSKTDKKKIEEETASDPTMTILNDARSVLFQRLKAKFGVYADPWAAGQNLREGLLYYEDGGPDACWLYPWTEALDELTRYIQVGEFQQCHLMCFMPSQTI